MSPQATAVQTARAIFSPAVEDAARHLFNDRTLDSYRHTLAEGIDRVSARVAKATGPFTGVSPDDLAPGIAGIDLDRPLEDTASALDELDEVYLRDAVYFHHPRYLAHLNCPVVIPALLGEAILSTINSSLDTWDQSAGGTLIERRLIDWTAGRFGLGPAADGIFTSGGSQSNFQALLLAREEALAKAAAAERPEAGITAGSMPGPKPGPMPAAAFGDRRDLMDRLRIFVSEAGHFSVRKSAKMLGLSPDAVVTVETDSRKRMRPRVLAWELEQCRWAGFLPMAVVATAGTTDFGSIDPLPALAGQAAEAGAWFHVDAAYGCGLLVSRSRRALLAGIEHADSVTVDFHKSFFQPVSSSALLVRDRATLRHATYHADYLNPARMVGQRIPNQVDKSIQTTRRFDALKLWLTLRVMGPDALGELFDEVIDRAGQAWVLLTVDPRFEVVTRSQLSTLVFRYLPPEGTAGDLADRANLYAREALAASGAAMVAGTKVAGRHYLKFTLLNPETTVDDIAHVLDLIAEHAAEYLATEKPL